jgi:hypothetical protein
MRTYSAIPPQPTIHTGILSSFTAEGLTRQEALAQPRRAEVILRHNPFAASPYIVTLSSPAFAFDGSDASPMRRDHVWDFATFNEARAWFHELFDANADMIVARQQPLKRERENTAVPWKVGDATILSRLIPYDIWLARTQSRIDKAPANSQTAVLHKPHESEDPLQKKRSEKCCSRTAVSRRRGAVAPSTLRRYSIVVPLPPILEMVSTCESFFSFGNC